MQMREQVMTNEAFFAFVQLPENRHRQFELRDGVIYEMPSASVLHGLIVANIFGLIWSYLRDHAIGYVLGDNNDFELAEGFVLQPDVAFIAKARMTAIPKRITFAPDLAVEVLSPSNTPLEMQHKVEAYLRYGAQMVWVVSVEDRAVRVYTPNADDSLTLRRLDADALLEGGTVLPGFSVQVRDLFPPSTDPDESA